MKNRPLAMSSNCCASVMSAPDSKSAVDTAETMPGRLSQDKVKWCVSIGGLRTALEGRSMTEVVSSILLHQASVGLHPRDSIFETSKRVEVEPYGAVNAGRKLVQERLQESLGSRSGE